MRNPLEHHFIVQYGAILFVPPVPMYNIIICNYFISYIISIVMRCNELIYIYIYIYKLQYYDVLCKQFDHNIYFAFYFIFVSIC